MFPRAMLGIGQNVIVEAIHRVPPESGPEFTVYRALEEAS
jgi:hypothetical protein